MEILAGIAAILLFPAVIMVVFWVLNVLFNILIVAPIALVAKLTGRQWLD